MTGFVGDTKKISEQIGGGKQRRYRKKELAPNNEKPYVDPLAHLRDVEGPFTNLIPPKEVLQFGQNTASGVLQIPTDIVGFADMLRVGVPSVFSAISDTRMPAEGEKTNRFGTVDRDPSYLTRLSEDFMAGILDAPAQQNVEEHLATKMYEFGQKNPTADTRVFNEYLEQYQDTQEFFDYLTSQLSPGFKLAQYANDWANRTVGLGKRPDEQTSIDDIGQIFGGSVVGISKGMMNAIKQSVMDRVGASVVNNAIAKTVGKAAELVTPVTMPLTPGNVALNTGVGVTLNETVRGLTDHPGLVHGDIADLVPLSPYEPADGHGVDIGGQIDNELMAAGTTLGAFLGFPGFRRKATDAAIDAVTRQANDASITGVPIAEQGHQLQPQLSPLTGTINSNAPVVKGANLFDADNETLSLLDAQMSAASQVNRVEAELNAINHGTLDNFGKTLPIVEIRRASEVLDSDAYELFNKYMSALQRKQLQGIKRSSIDDDIRRQTVLYDVARDKKQTREANNIYAKLTELYEQKRQMTSDDPTSRPMMQQWSDADVSAIIATAEKNTDIVALSRMVQKVSQDIVSYLHKNGLINDAERLRRSASWETAFPIRERSHPKVQNRAARGAMLFGDKIKRALDIETTQADPQGIVNSPKDALAALQQNLADAVRTVTTNNARRYVVDTLKKLPNADGNLLRRKTFDVQGQKLSQLTDAQYRRFGETQLGDRREDFIRVNRDGLNEFWEFSDKSITKSLQFAPLAAVPIFNASRRFWQNMTTGLGAPWFAFKTLFWDPQVAKSTMMPGRSLGLVDTWARRALGDGKLVNAIMDHVPLTGAILSSVSAIPYSLSMRATRSVGEKIASDLMHSSGMFNAIAQMPGGREFLTRVGTSATMAFDRSLYNLFSQKLPTSLSHVMDVTKATDDYGQAARKRDGIGRSVFNMYKAMLESMHISARLAFFAENYGRLEAKHGKGRVPKKELNMLVQETRNLSGDMSRTSLSKPVQALASVIPYTNSILQGTRHILSAAVPPSGAKAINALTRGKANMIEHRSNRFWSQWLGGILMPTLAGYAFIDAMGPEAQDDWYYKQPEWQRMSVVPFPSVEAITYMLDNGRWPDYDPKYINRIPLAPEFLLFNEPALAMARAMGLVGPAKDHLPDQQGKTILEQITSFATPSLIQGVSALGGQRVDLHAGIMGQGFMQPINTDTFGGANADMMTFNSGLSQNIYEAIGAIGSTPAQIVMQMMNVREQAEESGADFAEAAARALDTGFSEVTRRLPQVGIPGLFEPQLREYAFTPESEYVYQIERQLDIVDRQQSIETDSKERIEMIEEQGLLAPSKIRDPMLKQIMTTVYDALRKKSSPFMDGAYKRATDQYTDLRALLTALSASRGKLSEQAYAERYNKIVSDQQKLREVQARILTRLEEELTAQYGPAFQNYVGVPFSYKALTDAVRADVSSQTGE